MRPRLVVGLTGGIGSGKTAAAEFFAALGVPVIDTDRLAREEVEPGTPGLAAVRALAGDDVVDGEGRLDRRRLRERVFSDPALRRAVEAELHPRIRANMERRLAGLDAPYAIVAIPLLVEAGQRGRVDRVLVVDVPEELQVQRTASRDGTTEQAVRDIMAAQVSRAERLAAADDVIVNDGDLDALREHVATMHARYLELAGAEST